MQRIVSCTPLNQLTPEHTAFLVLGTLLKALKAGGGTGHGGNFYAITERRGVKVLFLATMNEYAVFCAILSVVIAKARYKAGYYVKFKFNFKFFHIIHLLSLLDVNII